jgi:SAM-dependent methyltransferase
MLSSSLSDKNAVRQVSRPCPVCGRASAEVLFRQSFAALETGGPVQGYDVVLCTTCGTAFADGIPTQSEFDRYYLELSKYEFEHRGGKESEDDSHRLKILADLIQPLVPDRDSRILEVGCANGRLLSYFKEAGYRQIMGVDPSPACAHSARTLYDVKVETGTVFSFPKPGRAYDFVVTLGVLEHIEDLRRAVKSIREAMIENGRIFVAVPNASNLIVEQDAPFQEFSTEHINFFSPQSLQYAMEAGGFRTIGSASVELELHRGVLTPTICGVFERSAEFRTEFPYDSTSREGLVRYVSECNAVDDRLRRKIRAALARGPVIVWGVGTHTRRLMANGVLRPSDVSAFVDSNPKYQNRQLAGIPVLSPDGLPGHLEPILISSYTFQEEISEDIRQRLRLPNELILLYKLKAEKASHD